MEPQQPLVTKRYITSGDIRHCFRFVGLSITKLVLNPMEKILAKAEETIVMKHALKNTTAVLRGLAAGNWTDIASLLSGAYAEVSSISSLLLGVDIG